MEDILYLIQKFLLIPDNTVKIFVLPDRRGPAVIPPEFMGREKLPGVDDFLERLVSQGLGQDVDMIVHYYAGIKLISAAIEVLKGQH